MSNHNPILTTIPEIPVHERESLQPQPEHTLMFKALQAMLLETQRHGYLPRHLSGITIRNLTHPTRGLRYVATATLKIKVRGTCDESDVA